MPTLWLIIDNAYEEDLMATSKFNALTKDGYEAATGWDVEVYNDRDALQKDTWPDAVIVDLGALSPAPQWGMLAIVGRNVCGLADTKHPGVPVLIGSALWEAAETTVNEYKEESPDAALFALDELTPECVAEKLKQLGFEIAERRA